MQRMRPRDPKPPLVLRQPPPPFCPHSGTGSPVQTSFLKEEYYHTEICSIRTRPFLFRKGKRDISLTNIASLPDEIIFEILVRVPAHDIYNATRLVCRNWYKMIHTRDFIQAHLHQSQSGFLTHGYQLELSFLASAEKGSSLTTEIWKLDYIFTDDVLSSCNGLVLEVDESSFCITNPVTRQNFALPPGCFKTPPVRDGYAIAYAATSMEYKVVRLLKSVCALKPQAVAILTVGVDKDWTRRVNTLHLTPRAKEIFLAQPPFATDGFVHWAQNNTRLEKGYMHLRRYYYVLTLNVKTEVITQFPIPPLCTSKFRYYYLPMGNYLSLLICRSKFLWEFWKMKPETGKWTEMPNIELEAQFFGDVDVILTPGGWLKPREVLVLSLQKKNDKLPGYSPYFVTCNVGTGEIHEFELKGGTQHFVVHRNSLVWMG